MWRDQIEESEHMMTCSAYGDATAMQSAHRGWDAMLERPERWPRPRGTMDGVMIEAFVRVIQCST